MATITFYKIRFNAVPPAQGYTETHIRAGTQVLCSNGYKNVEDVVAGDCFCPNNIMGECDASETPTTYEVEE